MECQHGGMGFLTIGVSRLWSLWSLQREASALGDRYCEELYGSIYMYVTFGLSGVKRNGKLRTSR